VFVCAAGVSSVPPALFRFSSAFGAGSSELGASSPPPLMLMIGTPSASVGACLAWSGFPTFAIAGLGCSMIFCFFALSWSQFSSSRLRLPDTVNTLSVKDWSVFLRIFLRRLANLSLPMSVPNSGRRFSKSLLSLARCVLPMRPTEWRTMNATTGSKGVAWSGSSLNPVALVAPGVSLSVSTDYEGVEFW